MVMISCTFLDMDVEKTLDNGLQNHFDLTAIGVFFFPAEKCFQFFVFCWKGSNIWESVTCLLQMKKIAGHWISTHPRGCMEIKNRHFLSQLLSFIFFSGCSFLQLRFRVEARTLSWELTYPRVISHPSRHFWVDDCPYPVWWNMLDLPPTQDAGHHQDLFLFFSRESRTKPSFVTVCQMGVDPRDMLVSWKVYYPII